MHELSVSSLVPLPDMKDILGQLMTPAKTLSLILIRSPAMTLKILQIISKTRRNCRMLTRNYSRNCLKIIPWQSALGSMCWKDVAIIP